LRCRTTSPTTPNFISLIDNPAKTMPVQVPRHEIVEAVDQVPDRRRDAGSECRWPSRAERCDHVAVSEDDPSEAKEHNVCGEHVRSWRAR
jgi:hypothetical protein